MLARARELGIVHIEIRAGDEGKADLLQRLQSKYALAGGCVLTDEQDALTQAMHYLMAETTADKSLALGWGYALGEVVAEGCGLQQLYAGRYGISADRYGEFS